MADKIWDIFWVLLIMGFILYSCVPHKFTYTIDGKSKTIEYDFGTKPTPKGGA